MRKRVAAPSVLVLSKKANDLVFSKLFCFMLDILKFADFTNFAPVRLMGGRSDMPDYGGTTVAV